MTPLSSFNNAFRTASIPRMVITSTRWFEVVLEKSTSGCAMTSSKLHPSVSSIHSECFSKVPVASLSCVEFASRMNTFLMSGIPRNASVDNNCASMRLRKTSSSMTPSSASAALPSGVINRKRKMSFSLLSSLKMT